MRTYWITFCGCGTGLARYVALSPQLVRKSIGSEVRGKLLATYLSKGQTGADIWSMPHNPPDQQSTGVSLKRTRAKQSCTRCRKQKLKCSGEVPCERCVRCNEQDSCELWHRVAGRPKNADTLQKLEACAYYRPVLLKVAMDFAHRGKPAPDLVVQLARLWLMVAVHQKGADRVFAVGEIARRTRIPIAHFKVGAVICPLSICLLPIMVVSYLSTTHLLIHAGRTSSRGSQISVC